jgi:hypothetical protein
MGPAIWSFVFLLSGFAIVWYFSIFFVLLTRFARFGRGPSEKRTRTRSAADGRGGFCKSVVDVCFGTRLAKSKQNKGSSPQPAIARCWVGHMVAISGKGHRH